MRRPAGHRYYWLGCQTVSLTRHTIECAKRRVTSTSPSSRQITPQAQASSLRGSKLDGTLKRSSVSRAWLTRSSFSLGSAWRGSPKPITEQVEPIPDGSMQDGRERALGRLVLAVRAIAQ
jgi:hypothetical protein